MSKWKEYKLGEVAEIIMGQSPKSETYNKNKVGLPFLQGNRTFGRINPYFDTYCDSPKKIASEKDILFSVRAPVGDINIAQTEICIGRGLASFRAINKEYRFLYYLLLFIKQNIISVESGTVYGSVNRTDLENTIVNTPPLPEQKAIAEVLSSLDDKIDLLHRQNETLEKMAETLFRKWFVEDADDSWEVGKLGDVTNVRIGRTPPRKESQWFTKDPKDIKWVSIKDMASEGVFLLETSEYLTREAVKEFNIPIIDKDTVMLSFKMTLGRVCISSEKMLSNEAIANFSLDYSAPISKEYLYLYLKQYSYDTLGSTSSIVTSINSAMIKNMEILIPDKMLISKFGEIVNDIFDRIKANQIQIRTLEKLRDTLLPKLISGEVRVGGV